MGVPDSVRALDADLRRIFTDRLLSLVVYRPVLGLPGARIHTLASVQRIDTADLRACAERVTAWHDAGLATPLVLPIQEFARSLDAFPLEFGAILHDHEVVSGADPFAGLQADVADLRRACEVQVRSHLLHLREGYIETRGKPDAISDLLGDSVAPLAGLLLSVARLLGHPTADALDAASRVEQAAHLAPGSLGDPLRHHPVAGTQARRVLEPYLDAVDQLTRFVDRWSPR